MEILFGDEIKMYMSTLAAACMLVFSLLYTPCVAAVASVKRELGTKWAIVIVIWQCVIAWFAALALRLICTMIGVG
jgi:ferrous iron transport protein B